MLCGEMEKALRVYGEVLRLVRRLPKDTRPYYAKYLRENFVNYREVDANDSNAIDELFHRAYNHSIWVLNKVLITPPALPPFLLIQDYEHLSFLFVFQFLLTHPGFLVNAVFGGSIGRG